MKNAAMLVVLKSVMLAVVVSGAVSLAGCNTMEGLGKDVSKLGNKIESKAEEKK